MTPSILLDGHDRARAGAIERDRQFRLPPEQRKQRDDQPGAMRGQHGQHEFDGIRQLNRDHGIGRQARFDEMRRQRRDRAIGLREGQAFWRLAGDARLVERIEQRQRIRLPRQDPAKQSVERRRCVGLDHGITSRCDGCRPLPPGFREISGQGGGLRPFYPIPARDPLLLNVKHRNSVEARHQGPVQRPHRRDESGMLARLQHGRDHGVDGGVLGAHVVSRALIVRGLAAPIERLLVARRQRLIPAVLDHVEIETEPALIELNGIDRAHRRLDAGALQIARDRPARSAPDRGSSPGFRR